MEAVMQPFFADYLERLADLHQDCHVALTDVPDAAINWVPAANMNSLAVLITHLTGAERYWIGDVAVGDPSDRIRAAEFEVTDADAQSLRSRLDEALAYAQDALREFSIEKLDEQRMLRMHNFECTVGWALLHALEHSALHTGQVQLTRQLWEQHASGSK
jgi:uncharacterized damage-inducible protein DinB